MKLVQLEKPRQMEWTTINWGIVIPLITSIASSIFSLAIYKKSKVKHKDFIDNIYTHYVYLPKGISNYRRNHEKHKTAVLDLNRIQKGFLTVAASIVIFWFLDGFRNQTLRRHHLQIYQYNF